MQKKIILSLLVLFVLIAGVLFYLRDRGYEVVHPHRGTVIEAVYGLGKVKSNHRFEVKLGVISTVKKVYVREGDVVQQGDKLIEFDSNALFRAPFPGTVTLISSWEGEIAAPQMVILRLEDLKDRYIEISFEQEGALRIQRGQKARVSFESIRGTPLEGKVIALFPKEDEFLAHVVVDHLGENILPGMTADVSVEIGQIKDALLIPLKAISNGMVLIKRGGRRQKIRVEIGRVDGMNAEIKGETLHPEDEVLLFKAKP